MSQGKPVILVTGADLAEPALQLLRDYEAPPLDPAIDDAILGRVSRKLHLLDLIVEAERLDLTEVLERSGYVDELRAYAETVNT